MSWNSVKKSHELNSLEVCGQGETETKNEVNSRDQKLIFLSLYYGRTQLLVKFS